MGAIVQKVRSSFHQAYGISKTTAQYPASVDVAADDHSHQETRGDTILHYACTNGNLSWVRRILAEGTVDINSRGSNNETPILKAAWQGHHQVVELLVERGADLSVVDVVGDNILHRACDGGHLDIMKLVLTYTTGCVNGKGYCGKTPLMTAVGSGCREMVELLVSKGADVSLVDNRGDNILHLACDGGHYEIMKYVLSQPIDINSRGRKGRTPVSWAARHGHTAMFNLLVNRGADLTLDGNIFSLACKGSETEIVKLVLSHLSVDINVRGCDGRTPVMQAVCKGQLEMVKLLVSKGADMTLVDNFGDNILNLACDEGHTEILQYVLSQDMQAINNRGRYGRTPVVWAAFEGHRDILELLVKKGVDLSLVSEHRNNILHLACCGGHVDIVKYVLSQNVVDANSRGHGGMTPAMFTAEEGHKEIYMVLVKKGVDLSSISDEGNTILHAACLGGNVEILRHILSGQMYVNCKRRDGMTPVMCAAVKGHKQAFWILVSAGADLSLASRDGDNILHLACRGGNVETVKHVLCSGEVDPNARNRCGETAGMIARLWRHRSLCDLVPYDGHSNMKGRTGPTCSRRS
ncbi:ankyrin repeat domain-containing protein 50-like [Haliotis rufescens]|uniref:ankyrin repeat domain-containing protein 50-like n=1 Tax=Haliotis rufescens TaxID=6454 RepID=UPI00201EF529|nr:ankyrin repeat domain-containing protein 50-like [Haliotis rufescens]